MAVNDDVWLEKEADEMGVKAASNDKEVTPAQLFQGQVELTESAYQWNQRRGLGEKEALIALSSDTAIKQRSVVQKNGGSKSSFTQTADPLKIAEFEFGEGLEIAFTPITSCIALLGKKGNSILGVHIALFKGNEPTTIAICDELSKILDGCTEIQLVGETGFWPSNIIESIKQRFHPPSLFDKGSGNYSAKLEAGEIIPSFKKSS
jgi:hypothetical protein